MATRPGFVVPVWPPRSTLDEQSPKRRDFAGSPLPWPPTLVCMDRLGTPRSHGTGGSRWWRRSSCRLVSEPVSMPTSRSASLRPTLSKRSSPSGRLRYQCRSRSLSGCLRCRYRSRSPSAGRPSCPIRSRSASRRWRVARASGSPGPAGAGETTGHIAGRITGAIVEAAATVRAGRAMIDRLL